MDIKSITQTPEIAGLQRPTEAKPTETEGGSFADVLGNSIAEVNKLQQQADASISSLASGEKASLHDTMIAMEQADVSFRMMMQVRNKIVEAYQEIMRMQI